MYRLSAKFRDRPLKQLTVERKAYSRDVPRLLASEKVSGASYLKIPKGKVVAASVPRVLPERIKTFTGIGIHQPLLRQKEVCVSLSRTASDASAQLVELRDPETVRTIDNNGVRPCDVKPGFDDRRADKHIGKPLRKAAHLLGKNIRRHLSMGHIDLRPRAKFTQAPFRLCDCDHSVVEIVHLSATVELALDGGAYRRVAVADDLRLRGDTFARRGLENGEIPGPGHREVERTRNRSGAHRKNVRCRAKAL